jgi:hypothetical protein
MPGSSPGMTILFEAGNSVTNALDYWITRSSRVMTSLGSRLES